MTNHSTDVKEHFEEMEGKEVSLAGRMMFKRVMGKASFCNIQDLKGRIQIYVARDSIGEESYADFHSCSRGNTAFQELTDSAGEVPRTDGYRYQISSEICRSHHE